MSNVTLSNFSNFLSSFKEFPIKLLKNILPFLCTRKETDIQRKKNYMAYTINIHRYYGHINQTPWFLYKVQAFTTTYLFIAVRRQWETSTAKCMLLAIQF